MRVRSIKSFISHFSGFEGCLRGQRCNFNNQKYSNFTVLIEKPAIGLGRPSDFRCTLLWAPQPNQVVQADFFMFVDQDGFPIICKALLGTLHF
jgi:hypothetical protein